MKPTDRLSLAIHDTEMMFNASNLSGLAHSFPGIIAIARENPAEGFDYNGHPLVVLWIEKMGELVGLFPRFGPDSPDVWKNAYAWYCAQGGQ